MSESESISSSIKPKKRHYSRLGCLECKKRRLKCDEIKPKCTHCVKYLKQCLYLHPVKFSKLRTVVLEDAMFVPYSTEQKTNQKDKRRARILPQTISKVNVDNTRAIAKDMKVGPKNPYMTLNFDENKQKLIESQEDIDSMYKSTAQNFLADVLSEVDQLLLDEVSLLTHGLSDNMTFINDLELLNEALSPRDIFFDVGHPESEIIEANDARIQHLIASHDKIADHKNYLRLFQDKYSLWIMPFSSESENVCSSILLGRALKFPFLAFAIISMTARYESFCHGDPTDKYYQKYYFKLCCEDFSRIFKVKSHIPEYIEPLILTTLLLVTDSVAFVNGNWRSHLKAAQVLFAKYVDIYKKTSAAILLSTIWFATFELLAVGVNPVGGSITLQEEFAKIIKACGNSENGELSVHLGLIMANGYNVFFGCSAETLNLFSVFAQVTIKIKKNDRGKVAHNDLAMLISEVGKASETYLASRDGLIKRNNPYHPNNATGMLLPVSTYGYADDFIFSWFDVSDKAHIKALYLKMLCEENFLNLSIDDKLVQGLVKDILDCCLFFRSIYITEEFKVDEYFEKNPGSTLCLDRRLLMVHWPLLTCGLCCIDVIDRLKIEIFFKGMIKMGARSLESSFNVIKNKWKGTSEYSDFLPFV
ncbi:uncharacterized protein PRCAT00004171001 [Priceomyces carsonii]|uniref:uncharacterized protein n=1 Tax=Priceomyces carsonii TaxID=28549 RepID=UPI002EDAC09F|nr:unnamed protein product [Priceomyces carsonii]